MALVTLVYANIAISWQLPRFNSLKKHFPQFYRFKKFENGLEKNSPDLNFFPQFWLKNPDFPDWKKSSKFSLNTLIGGNPGFCNSFGHGVSAEDFSWGPNLFFV